MLKYYIFAFIKANLVTFLIFLFLFFIGAWQFVELHWYKILIVANIFYQIEKVSYIRAEVIEEEWRYIRLTECRKWYERYTNAEIRKKLNSLK